MRKLSLLLIFILSCAICAAAQNVPVTQGTLNAYGKNAKNLGACPLKHTDVKAEISGFILRVKVVQGFENNFAEPIEAVYVFPLSQNSAVDAMTMTIGTRTINGKIMKREEARKIYEAAKTEGKTASLLDQERPNIFTQSVANILPNEKIVVEISYVETLRYEDGAYQFVFPTVVAPRYIPGSVTDANKISPPAAETRAGHDISIQVSLDAGVPIEKIKSKSHEIETLNLSSNSAKVTLKDEAVIPNKDFILRYDVSGKRIEDAILTHRDERGGFFTLMLQPPDNFAVEDITSKEIVFVLDTSGSMGGFPIEKAKEAMKMSLDGLYPNDTFNLITFAGETAILFDEPVPATRANLDKAQEFLESRQGSGGTEMMKAIKAALEPSDANNHLRIVCFMTDGEVGNDAEIIAEVQKHQNARVFSFGIGSSINRFLLDKIAEEGRGEAVYVALTDDGSSAAKKFYERVRTPLLTDISIDWNGLPVADVYPNKISDLFSAKPVILHGRYTKAAGGTIRLKGRVNGQEIVREIPVNLPAAESKNDVLATLWARTRIDDLTKKDYQNIKPEVQQTITNLGLEYNLLTQFTSFVAVEEKIVNYQGQPKKVEVPVELPQGMSGDSPFRRLEIMASLQRPPQVRFGQGSGSGSGQGSGNGSGNAPPPAQQSLNSLPINRINMSSFYLMDGSSGSENTFVIDGSEVTNFRTGQLNSKNEVPKTISGGVINGKALSLPKPAFSAAAKAVRASGAVAVQVTIDEDGKVISANAVSGHPLLRQSAEQAARNAKFAPTLLQGKPVKITGVVVYNFTGAAKPTNISLAKMRLKPLTLQQKKNLMLAEKLHFWIYDLVERLQKGETAATPNELKFAKDGKAEVQIQLNVKSSALLEKLKTLGFEVVDGKSAKIIVGKIAVEKLAELAGIAEIQYVLPHFK